MALTLKLLYNNTISASSLGVTTYHSPTTQTAKGWLIKGMTFTNTSTVDALVTIFFKQGTGGFQQNYVYVMNLLPGTSYRYQYEITLNCNLANPDIIGSFISCLSGTGPTVVDVVMTGIERDQ